MKLLTKTTNGTCNLKLTINIARQFEQIFHKTQSTPLLIKEPFLKQAGAITFLSYRGTEKHLRGVE